MEPATIVSLIAVGINTVVGVILAKQIKSQAAVLTQYKDLVTAMDPAKIKAAMELVEQGYDAKYKLWAQNELHKAMEGMQSHILNINQTTVNEYNELMSFAIFFANSLTPIGRERFFSDLKQTGHLVRKHWGEKHGKGGTGAGAK